MNRNDLYERITGQILAQLENGVAPWTRPWATVGGGMPKNIVSGKNYRGVNTLMLWAASEAHGYESNLWGTFRQWRELGGYVNKGEHGTKIIYWNVTTETVLDEDTGDETEEKRFFAREYTVFNLNQCGGDALNRFRVTRPAREFVDYQPAEAAIAATGADIRHGGNQAFYRVSQDFIQMPPKAAFENPASYYSTALHELSHWTGHESRLRRIDKLARFGDNSYAAEELVAEMASAFLTASLGVPNERNLDNAAAYLADWLKIMRADKRAIFTAATAASAAAEYVLAFSSAMPTEVEPVVTAA